ncbi:MAG: aminoglycoside phosphotransferase family protein [Actinobacteria bacterium]|nr:aminoglycoside phosphotransferase family protein [Actinomycetota bacterium]
MTDQPRAVLARRPSELTVAWAQRVLDRHVPGAAVAGVDVLSVDVGTTTRVRLAVDHDGPPALPRRWFVKLPSLSWRARWITALPRLLQAEARFYGEVARALPVPIPPFLAAQSRRGWGATVVLADVTEGGAVAGAPADALSAEQAVLVIEQLARLHARLWNAASLDREYDWLAGPVRRSEDRLGSALAVPLMRHGLRRAGSAVPTALHAPALGYARRRRQVMRFLADGPRTLVHHDVHPGNLFWQKSEPGLLDWHLVRIGEGIGDVAYLLATSLTPETRRAHEVRLLARYQQVLAEHGVRDLDGEVLRCRYRAHLVYPFEAMVLTLAVGGMMTLENTLELIRRAAAAAADHDSFAAGPLGPRARPTRPRSTNSS